MIKLSGLIFCVALLACGMKEKNLIVNNWQVSDMRYEQATSDSASLAMLETMKTTMKGMTYHFEEDGTYNISGAGGGKSGTYTVDPDGKTFEMKGTNSQKFVIIELTKDKFSFKSPTIPVIVDCVPAAAE